MTFSEVIKVRDGKIFNLAGHRERMDRTARCFFGRTMEFDPTVPPDMRTGLVKCRVVYGMAGVESVEFSPYTFRTIGSVAVVHDDGIEYEYKSTDRSRLDSLRERSGADEVIIVRRGLVTDASFANLVLEERSGALRTPSTPLLRGTKRESLLHSGVIVESEVRPEDLFSAAKIYLINAMIDLEDRVAVGARFLQ